jgi:hypothetical protein
MRRAVAFLGYSREDQAMPAIACRFGSAVMREPLLVDFCFLRLENARRYAA